MRLRIGFAADWANALRSLPAAVVLRLPYISVAIATCLILVAGPRLQLYSLALLNGDTLSPYDAVYKSGIGFFPSLLGWFQEGLISPLPLAGVIVAWISVKISQPQKLFRMAAAGSAITLTMIDIVFMVYNDNLSLSEFVQTLFANLFGSVFLVAILLLILGFSEAVANHISGSFSKQRIIGSITCVLTALVASMTLYYATEFFYRPLPVRLELIADHPIDGFVVVDKEDPTPLRGADGKTVERPRFSIFPEVKHGGHVLARGVDRSLTVDWGAADTLTKFDLSIGLYTGCWNASALPKGASIDSFIAKDVRRVRAKFDEGSANLEILPPSDSDGNFKVRGSELFSFSTSVSGDASKLVEFDRHDKDSVLSFENSDDETSFFLVAPLMRIRDSDSRLSMRSLDILIDDRKYSIKFTPPSESKNGDKVICQSLAGDISENSTLVAPRSGVMAGVLFRLKAREIDTNYSVKTNTATVTDVDALSLSGLKREQFGQAPAGRLEALFVRGTLTEVKVNGQARAVSPVDDFYALGNMSGSFEDSGKIRIDGTVTSLWHSSHRINPTKWETLDWEPRAGIGVIILALLTWLVRRFVAFFTKNEQFEWMSQYQSIARISR
ncbi:hypothetical protein ACFWXH_04755 [Mesorhizobium sp. NPDC059054]|uniref:hypothetical protein n=1 Tax=Mesorhizobium sp. NPDC059054 TaxID=3346711 RepID=UPI0036984A57